MHDKNGSLILKAVKQNGIYIVNRIAKGLQSVAFPASVQQHLEAQVDNPADPMTGSNDTSPESKGRSRYLLWHKRFAHMGEQKLKNLHQVTTLQRAIHKPRSFHMLRSRDKALQQTSQKRMTNRPQTAQNRRTDRYTSQTTPPPLLQTDSYLKPHQSLANVIARVTKTKTASTSEAERSTELTLSNIESLYLRHIERQ